MGEYMRKLALKYLQHDTKSGTYFYRRRVPIPLKGRIPQGEFFEFLGKTEEEAMRNWSRVHQRIEHSLGLARDGVTGLSESALQERLVVMLKDLGAEPHSQGVDENERTWRDAKADRIVERYQDPKTGDYNALPDEKRAVARALTQGVSKETIEPTVNDAFAFYLTENPKEVPEQLKKQVQRFARSERRLISVLQGDRALCCSSYALLW
ncbi:MAG: hypothetical protein ACI9TA_001272 [Reinekea sp.]|jgi:hypothetical protein